MHKKEYEDETPDKGSFWFWVAIVAFVVMLLVFLPQHIRYVGVDRYLIIEVLPVILLAIAIGFFGYRIFSKSHKATKNIINMKQTGRRVPARIIRVDVYHVFFRGRQYKTTYGVVVECNIDGKDLKLTSKSLSVNPIKSFASANCYVYYNDVDYVITDFTHKDEYHDGMLDVEVLVREVDEGISYD